jgi:hypothetical protein
MLVVIGIGLIIAPLAALIGISMVPSAEIALVFVQAPSMIQPHQDPIAKRHHQSSFWFPIRIPGRPTGRQGVHL